MVLDPQKLEPRVVAHRPPLLRVDLNEGCFLGGFQYFPEIYGEKIGKKMENPLKTALVKIATLTRERNA